MRGDDVNTDDADDPEVSEAVEDLAADFDRTGRPLELERVERLVAKRQLRFSQMERILDALAAAGVEVLTRGDDLKADAATEPDGESVRRVRETDVWWRALLEHPLLDAKTEVELGRTLRAGESASEQIQTGGDTPRAREAVRHGAGARDRLATSNFRLVWTWAAKYAVMTGLDTADLFQDGVIGLLRAVDKFDPDAGFRFSTYAVWWIRQAIQRAVHDRGRTVRLPVHVHDQLFRLSRATKLLWREHGKRPTLRLLSEELAMEPEHIAFLQGLASLVPISLDAETWDGEGEPLVETVSSEQETPEELVGAAELAQQIRDAIQALPNWKMRDVVSRRNGIGNGGPETLESIGSSYGLTRERVRQIEAQAMKRLEKSIPRRLGWPDSPDQRAER